MSPRSPSGGQGPPRLATWLLRKALPGRDRDQVSGEMEELFHVRRARRGRRAARRWYRRQIVVFVWTMAVERLQRLRPGGGEEEGGAAIATTPLARLRGDGDATRGGGAMTGWMGEARQGIRRLGRAPVFTAVAVLTVAVGIGAFASVFSAVDSVLLEPVPYEEPDELVWIWRDYSAWFPLDRGWLGGPDVARLGELDEVFDGVVAIRSGMMNLTGRPGTEPAEVAVMLTSASFFRVLGVEPILGRGFLPREDEPGAPQVVVLGHDLWQGRYGGDPDVVGGDIYLDGERSTVVGVAPSGFRFVKHASQSPTARADVYVPLRMDLADQDPGSGMFAGLARIRDGVSPAEVERGLAGVASRLDREAFGDRGLRLWTVGLKEDLVAPVRRALLALLGAAAFLLLILAANLATLFLGRSAVRERELGVRSALGAGRARIVGSVLGESLLIAGAGGALGLLFAFWGAEVIAGMAPSDLPRRAGIGLDGSVVMVGVLITCAMGLAAGLGPALRVLGTDLVTRIGDGAGRSGGSTRASRTRSALVVVQVALSLMLLAGGGLLARAFADLVRSDPGFDGGEAVTFRVPLDPARYADSAAVAGFEGAFRERLAALPGIGAVGATSGLPLSGGADQTGATFPGAPGNTGNENEDRAFVDYLRASPGYVEAAGLRVLSGRSFRKGDGLGGDSAGVAVIDDVLARRFFPSETAVGRRLRMFSIDLRIVGVVDQPRLYGVHEDGRGQVYLPLATLPDESPSYVIRAGGGQDPVSLLPAARRILRELDPQLPLTAVATLDEMVRASMGQQRLSLILVGAFAVGALLLATLGIYGVVANSVVRRTREMGVRMALGAGQGRVVATVLGQGLRLAVVGAGAGLVGALLAAGLLEGVVVGVQARDPTILAGTALLVVALAAAASYVPARRATRIDPVEALRLE